MILPNVIFEDDAVIVIDKPAGCSSEQNVPAALRAYWNAPSAYVGIVHRLDTGVCGLMVYAKTPAAAAALSRQITQSQNAYALADGRAALSNSSAPGAAPLFIKQYRAVIAGVPDDTLPPNGVLRDLLFKDSRKGRVFPVKRARKGVKEAVLEYSVAASASGPAGQGSVSLVNVTLHTGRTHQIRVQFASRRHPLWGDGKYGSREKGALALQSASLTFLHPTTGHQMHFALPAPQCLPWTLFLDL